MFAPHIAKAQTKSTASSTNVLVPERSTLAGYRSVHEQVEQAQLLQRTIGNQATLRLLAYRASSLTGNEPGGNHDQDVAAENTTAWEVPRSAPRTFSKIPLFPPDRANLSQGGTFMPSLAPQSIRSREPALSDRPTEAQPRQQTTLAQSTAAPAAVQFGHDFSQISIYPPDTKATQTELAISQPGDASEREADGVAEQITATAAHLAVRADPQPIQSVHRQSDRNTDSTAASVRRALANPGTPLQPGLRQDMERRFGHDFSRVRVHSGPAAEQSARDVDANAYTVGHHIVFGAGGFTSAMQPERRLLAHELTHVLQQTGPLGHAASALHPGVLQRDPKDTDPKKKEAPKKKEDPKVEAAKKKLQDKFGIGEFTQEEGESWTESQLTKLGAAFAKMSADEQESLKGVTLHRVKKIDRPQGMEGMDKKIVIAAETTPGEIKFTAGGFDKNTPIHEAGHLIRFKQLQEIGTTSKAAIEEDALRKKVRAVGPTAMAADMTAVKNAATALRDSNDEERAARTRALDDAMDASLAFRMGPEIQSASDPKALEADYDALDKWLDAVRRVAAEKGKIINEFITIVQNNKLAKKGFLPFTDYVAFNWPKKPNEFLVECYATWRNNPDYMKAHAKSLYEWFQGGGHLVPKSAAASKPQP
jgi:hypothetical protein